MRECKYCTKNLQDFISEDFYNPYDLEIDPTSKSINVWYEDHRITSFGINYCPMCGRKLRNAKNKEN